MKTPDTNEPLRSGRWLDAFRPALNCLLMFILGWGVWRSPMDGACLAVTYCYARREIRNVFAANNKVTDAEATP